MNTNPEQNPEPDKTPEDAKTLNDTDSDVQRTLPESMGIQTSFRDIGPYRILKKIGEGGMGTVFLAEQEKPIRRKVAIKLIKSASNSKQVLTRFNSERQALALMDHPNIAKILDAGTTDDEVPYFAMELVDGVPLHKFCDQHRLTIKERLNLFIPICQAVQHAHQKGVIHRDLKPSNVLVEIRQGKPIPKVIDFGLAKAIDHSRLINDQSLITEFGKIVGTIQYMSPEQAQTGKVDVDTRTDIYSLGVILYQLLTGCIPLDDRAIGDQAILKVLEIVRDHEPQRPSVKLVESSDSVSLVSQQRQIAAHQLHSLLKGDLDWIVMKAIDKERDRRYESAGGFADDIRRYLDSRVIVARPPSTAYRIRKFVGRNQLLVGTATIIAALLVFGAIGTGWFAYQAHLASVEEEKQKKIAVNKSLEADLERQRAIQARDGAITAADRSSNVLGIVTSAFRSTNPNAGADSLMTADQVLMNANEALKKSNLDDEGRVLLLGVLTEAFFGLGRYERVVETGREFYRIASHLHGAESDIAMMGLSNLAVALNANGKYNESYEPIRKVYEFGILKWGQQDPRTIEAGQQLSLVYLNTNKIKEAYKLSQEIYQSCLSSYGADHKDTLSSMGIYAGALLKSGRPHEAVKLYQQNFKRYMDVFSKNEPPNALLYYKNYAEAVIGTGDFEKAIEILVPALEMHKEQLGPKHPQTTAIIGNLALAYLSAGRFMEAIPLAEVTYEQMKERLGATHPDTVAALGNLAQALFSSGEFHQSVTLYRQAVKIQTENLGANHLNTLMASAGLATSLYSAGKALEAIEVMEKVLAGMKSILGAGHFNVLQITNNLAVIYNEVGDFEKAIAMLPAAIEESKTMLGENHPTTFYLQSSYCDSLGSSERIKEALKLMADIYQRSMTVMGRDHFDVLGFKSKLAVFYRLDGQFEKSIEIGNEVLEQLNVVAGSKHPRTLATINNLAVAYMENGSLEPAIKLAKSNVEAVETVLGESHPNTLDALNLAGDLYHKNKEFDLALEMFVRELKIRRTQNNSEIACHELQLRIAGIYFDKGDFERSSNELETLLDDTEQAKEERPRDAAKTLSSIRLRAARKLLQIAEERKIDADREKWQKVIDELELRKSVNDL